MKIMIVGANGQLGSDLAKVIRDGEVIPLTHSDIEISDENSVRKVFQKYKPAIVMNTAAYHHVPKCESNDTQAFLINALGPKYLAQYCEKYGSTLLHISTDYLFDGLKKAPYVETDAPNPLNVYGISKMTGEHYIRAHMTNYFIVRTSGIYGIHPCRAKGRNFIDTMLMLSRKQDEIRVVGDEILTPTYTLDLAHQIHRLIQTHAFGIYHITNEGYCSWHQFAKTIFEILNIPVQVTEISQSEFSSTVKRPAYSVLENGRLKSMGLNTMRPWKEALESYLLERRKLNLI